MYFCPFDCSRCNDHDCITDGCRLAAAVLYVACDQCGDLHEAALDPPLCRACILLEQTRDDN